jgi:hypothetical protein
VVFVATNLKKIVIKRLDKDNIIWAPDIRIELISFQDIPFLGWQNEDLGHVHRNVPCAS